MSRNPKRPAAGKATSCQCGTFGRTLGWHSKQCRVLPKVQPFLRQLPCSRRLLVEWNVLYQAPPGGSSDKCEYVDSRSPHLRQIFDCYTLMKLRPCPSRNSSLAFLPAVSFATRRGCVDSCALWWNGR